MAGKIKQIWAALANCFQANDDPLSMGQIVAWIGLHYADTDFNPVTLKAQIYRSCVNVAFAQKYNTPKILFYDKRTRKYSLATEVGAQERDQGDSPEATVIDSDEGELESLGIEDYSDLLVGVEAQLRDYLAKNLGKLEKGLSFWHESPPSVEYTINGRRIDILAKDLQGNPVVIELKRERAYDRVVGQALLYQALVSAKFGASKVRVILVANEMTTELRLACTRQLDFTLFEYELTMQLNPVSISITEGEY
jgi:RecB family endonuclease NucS